MVNIHIVGHCDPVIKGMSFNQRISGSIISSTSPSQRVMLWRWLFISHIKLKWGTLFIQHCQIYHRWSKQPCRYYSIIRATLHINMHNNGRGRLVSERYNCGGSGTSLTAVVTMYTALFFSSEPPLKPRTSLQNKKKAVISRTHLLEYVWGEIPAGFRPL